MINKAAATVTLSNLTQTYTGSALTPTAATTPSGLSVTWSGAPDTAAGSYPVTATINDPNYAGSASGTFVINKAAATVIAEQPDPDLYRLGADAGGSDDSHRAERDLERSPGHRRRQLSGDGTINDPNYAGSASGTFVVSKAAATVIAEQPDPDL